MKTLLDLIQEYAVLNDAKTSAGGTLPPEEEKRWAELKSFYDLLMSQQGLHPHPVSRFTAADIQRTVTTRKRLRVNTDLEIVVFKNGRVESARVDNLSCGGVLLFCDAAFGRGNGLTLHLANISRGSGTMAADSEVVWSSDRGNSDTTFRYKLGIRFLSLREPDLVSLDSFVVDCLENKLLSLGRDALAPEFLSKEQISL